MIKPRLCNSILLCVGIAAMLHVDPARAGTTLSYQKTANGQSVNCQSAITYIAGTNYLQSCILANSGGSFSYTAGRSAAFKGNTTVFFDSTGYLYSGTLSANTAVTYGGSYYVGCAASSVIVFHTASSSHPLKVCTLQSSGDYGIYYTSTSLARFKRSTQAYFDLTGYLWKGTLAANTGFSYGSTYRYGVTCSASTVVEFDSSSSSSTHPLRSCSLLSDDYIYYAPGSYLRFKGGTRLTFDSSTSDNYVISGTVAISNSVTQKNQYLTVPCKSGATASWYDYVVAGVGVLNNCTLSSDRALYYNSSNAYTCKAGYPAYFSNSGYLLSCTHN